MLILGPASGLPCYVRKLALRGGANATLAGKRTGNYTIIRDIISDQLEFPAWFLATHP